MVRKPLHNVCKYCSQFDDGSCMCEDCKLCRDCPMPRCVMLADNHPEELG